MWEVGGRSARDGADRLCVGGYVSTCCTVGCISRSLSARQIMRALMTHACGQGGERRQDVSAQERQETPANYRAARRVMKGLDNIAITYLCHGIN